MTTLRQTTACIALFGFLSVPLVAQAPGGAPGAGGPPRRPLPLDATRKAEFTATKGTWMSLDVSPDGQTIVFDLLGDLYTMPITGGRATALTSGLAFDAQPRFSPDGRKIVFVSDRSGGDNLWSLSLDGRDTTQLTQGNGNLYISPEWTPDGKYVVASRSAGLGGAAKIYLFPAEGGGGIQLTRNPQNGKTVGASFTPDGRYVWYAVRAGDWHYNALMPQYQLARYDRETGNHTTLTNRYGSAFRPAVSPDGKYLVYGSRHEAKTGLRARNLETGDEQWLAYPIQRDDMEGRGTLDVLPGYAFTPDSRSVILSYGGEIWRIPVTGGTATRIPFEAPVRLDVGPEVKFTYRVDTAAQLTARQIRNPVVSPDGRRVAFTALDRLYVADLPDGTPRRVTTADIGEFHPAWSRDGRMLAWVSWNERQGGHIHRIALDERNARPVQVTTTPALYYNIAWSPTSSRLVATRAAARELAEATGAFFGPVSGDFVWVPTTGGEVTRIAPTAGRDVLHFTSDTTRLYAYGPGSGLVSFRWDGTDQKQHLRVVGPPPAGLGLPVEPNEVEYLPRRIQPVRADASRATHAGELEQGPPPPAGLVLMSPTGDMAVAQVGTNIYTMPVVTAGGPPPTVNVMQAQGGPVPVRKVTDVGGEFPSFSTDGRTIYFGMGNVLATYSLDRAKAVEDSTRAAQRVSADSTRRAQAAADSLRRLRALADSLTRANQPVPDSVRLRRDSLQARATADSLVKARADSIAKADTTRKPPSRGYQAAEQKVVVQAPRDMPRGVVVLRGGRALTMKGHEIIENADIVIRDNRIIRIGPRGQVPIPGGARVIDVAGKTIIPGFIDTHYHAQWLTPEIHPTQVWQYITTLAYGVTTTRDPQTSGTDVLSYQDRVEMGAMLGPRIYSTGPGVGIPDGENIRDLDHARSVMKRYSQYWNTHTLKMYMSGNRQQRQWILMAAKELGIMPTTEGGVDYKLNITHALDGYPGIEHSLPIAPIYDDVVQLFKTSQTTNSPTLLVAYGGPWAENLFYSKENIIQDQRLLRFMPKEQVDARGRRRGTVQVGYPMAGWVHESEQVYNQHAAFVKALVEGGARAAVGSHGQLQGLGYHWELWATASGGISTHDALRTATIYGAEAIGMGADLGSLEVGKLADLIVLNGDPLTNIRNTNTIRYVMKNGRLHDGDTMDEVWPRRRPLPTQWWRIPGPEGVAAGMRSTGPAAPLRMP